MKKYKKIIILVTSIILSVLVYRYLTTIPKLNTENIKDITIITLPSPPKVKTVNRKEDIKEFVNYYNTISGKPLLYKFFLGFKGWEVMVNINNGSHTLRFIGNELEVDGRWFLIDSKVKEQIIYLYNKFEYEEGNYSIVK